MAEISGSITGLHWLNPTGSPIDKLLAGAQVGTMMARSMQQRQALSMEAAKLPFQIQALDTHNKRGEAALVEQWMQNEQIKSEREAWQQDLVTTEPFMTETDPNKLSAMPIPVASSARMQTAVHNRALAASQHQDVESRTAQYTLLHRQAAEVRDGGETLTPVKDPFGVMTYDPGEIAAKKLKIAERIQAEKIALRATGIPRAQSEVTTRQREQWIATRAAKIVKDKGLSSEESFKQATLEREVAEGKQDPATLTQEERRRFTAERIPAIDAELATLSASKSWFGKEKRASRIAELKAERNKLLGQGGSMVVPGSSESYYDQSTGKVIRRNAP